MDLGDGDGYTRIPGSVVSVVSDGGVVIRE